MQIVQEGRSLAGKYVSSDDSLMYPDFTNVMNFGSFKSPKNSFSSIDRHVNLSERNFPPADFIFQDVDYILLPQKPLDPDTVALWLKIYGADMQKRFHEVGMSENFKLLRKNSGG